MFCIICRAEKSQEEFNIEHVIPEAIGGCYKIRSVCRSCNASFSNKVDKPLLQSSFVWIMRAALNIQSKGRPAPPLFPGVHSLETHPDIKVLLQVDVENKQMETKIIPTEIYDPKNNTHTLVFDANDPPEKTIERFAKKHNVPLDKLKSQTHENSRINIKLDTENQDYRIGLLKIAYEFAATNLPQYLHDDMGLEICRILHEGDLNSALQWPINGVENGLSRFQRFINHNDQNHYLVLQDSPTHGLICWMKIFNVICCSIQLSNKAYLNGDLIVLANDIENRKAIVCNSEQVIKRCVSCRNAKYSFTCSTSSQIAIVNSGQKLNFFHHNNRVALFDRRGELAYADINTFLKQIPVSNEFVGDVLFEHYNIPHELYLKLLPSEELLRLSHLTLEKSLRTIL